MVWSVVPLPAPPGRLGPLDGGGLCAMHEQCLGDVSSVDVTGPGVTTVTGPYLGEGVERVGGPRPTDELRHDVRRPAFGYIA
ncbi:hypothetical protein L6R50_06625 [Myxococcota bacterium]|nr:hypothetical protein [Myxococcota bacterium]